MTTSNTLEPHCMHRNYEPFHHTHVALNMEGKVASGLLVRNHIVVTVDHVIDDYVTDEWTIQDITGEQLGTGKWIAVDENRLLAALHVPHQRNPTHTYRPSNTGEALGNGSYVSTPKGFFVKPTTNIRCEYERTINNDGLRTTMSPVVIGERMVFAGESGSPLFDVQGRIVGMINGGDYCNEIYAVNAYELIDFIKHI